VVTKIVYEILVYFLTLSESPISSLYVVLMLYLMSYGTCVAYSALTGAGAAARTGSP